MTRSTALALLGAKTILGASLAFGFLASPAGNAAPHVAAMDSAVLTAVPTICDVRAHPSPHHYTNRGGYAA